MSRTLAILVVLLLTVIAGSTVVIAVCLLQPSGYEHAVFSVNDRQLRPAMDRLGAQGWTIVSARRAAGDDPTGTGVRDFSYELIVSRKIPHLWARVPPRGALDQIMIDAVAADERAARGE